VGVRIVGRCRLESGFATTFSRRRALSVGACNRATQRPDEKEEP
jgi:hypothetical protein